MSEWIVIWTVLVTVSTGCPNSKPNPYTGEYSMVSCAVLHTKTVERKMKKLFSTEDAAREFISKAPDEIKKTMRILVKDE